MSCKHKNSELRCKLLSEITQTNAHISDSLCVKRCKLNGEEGECRTLLDAWHNSNRIITISLQENPTEQEFFDKCRDICGSCGLCSVANARCTPGNYRRGFFCRENLWPDPPTEELKKAKKELDEFQREINASLDRQTK